ncbi:hypothetical protein V1264_020003 [Littorina saxatilis]|uniref:ADP-sugar pyrophosphatase n=1 Tax=Littorina saxatilis TaxID=31220 RepID=A0AAN9B959_9CAEN
MTSAGLSGAKRHMEDSGDSEARTGRSQHVRNEEIAKAKWLSLNEITYKDPTGKERKWEAVYRTTNTGDGADAVVVIPIIKQSQKKDSLILVKQYRPPLKAYSIEFPAGLIDKGESPLECAVREMKEETGYTGIPKDCSPGISLDPGLSSSTVNMVTLEINGDVPENSNPQQHQDDTEFIEVFRVPKDEFLATLNKCSAKGDVVHSVVYAYAVALVQMAKQ